MLRDGGEHRNTIGRWLPARLRMAIYRRARGFSTHQAGTYKRLQVEGSRWSPNGSERRDLGSFIFDAEVHPGEVVVAARAIDFGVGRKVVHVLGWECFQTTDAQYERIGCVGWRGQPWFGRSPADLRRLADQAYAVESHLAGPASVRMQKLSNGTTARLVAVADPTQHPLMVWNPDGGKQRWSWDACLSHFESEQRFVGVLELYDTNTLPPEFLVGDRYIDGGFAMQEGLGRWYGIRVAEGDAATGQIRFAVGAGPWTEVGPIAVGEDVVFEGVTVRMPQKPQALPGGHTIPVTSRSREWEFRLVATNLNGERVEGSPDQWPAKFVTGSDDGGGFSFTRFAVPADRISEYTLQARKVEWVKFDHVAREPVEQPQGGGQGH